MSFHVVVHPRLGSTNDEAGRLAREGAPEGTVVQALEQTGGRGRRGRGWESPPGNLYASTILRPRRPLAEAALLSFVAALAAADTARELLGPGPDIRCKWPNDVLIGGCKFVGILLEADGRAEPEWLVIGTGINVRHHPGTPQYPATSLADAGAPEATVEDACRAYVIALARWYGVWRDGGFGPIREAWLGLAAGLGGPVTVRLAGRTEEGVFAGLDTDGVLLLDRAADGARVRISAGDVFFPQGAKG
jgi:BirA family transcriptional regulator, biotin operon repressor / biotin---[acetyl-CoA-carboxylase] ligase